MLFTGQHGYTPWHIWTLFEDINKYPMSYVLSEEGRKKWGDTFNYLAGRKIKVV
jgi:hypothetical protein